jgi:hypothetical protein
LDAQGLGLQFSIRRLLATTAFVAFAIWSWPHTWQPPGSMVFGILPALILFWFFFAPSAWRSYRLRYQAAAASPAQISRRNLRREGMSLACALMAIIPAGLMWLLFLLDPFESGHPWVHRTMEILLYLAISLCAGSILFLIITLIMFRGARQNFPLLLLRSVTLATNVLWPPVFYFAVLTKL